MNEFKTDHVALQKRAFWKGVIIGFVVGMSVTTIFIGVMDYLLGR